MHGRCTPDTGCCFLTCLVPIKGETDSEWDPDATDVDTEVDTDTVKVTYWIRIHGNGLGTNLYSQ